MILENIKTLDIENIGDTEDGIEAGISEDSMPFVFEFVSTQLYSNPIGSLIREITSNCHDSHVEAGNEDPVIIRMFSTPDEGWFIEFIDKGVGISVDRMYRIYMNYFSSTKRGDNSQIGGFGLGSKTPLAYQDYFYIDTIFDGLKYNYLYHKGEKKPTLESLKGYYYEEEEYEVEVENEAGDIEVETRVRQRKIPIGELTEERNGTTVRVHIKDTFVDGRLYNYTTDLTKFKSELIKQLTYFDNVYFQNCSVSNEYDIYEGKYFKFRSDIDQFNANIHICLGNVRYNLDTNVVKIPSEMIQVPIAVKFEVGELKVTPSRESLRYTESDIAKIKERVLLLRQELTDRFELQNPVVENLQTFIRNRSQTIRIYFDQSKGHYLKLWSGSSFARTAKYSPLKDLPIRYPENLFFMWRIVATLSYGTMRQSKGVSKFTEDEFMHSRYLIIEDVSHLSQYTNIYINETLYHGEMLIITKDSKIKIFDGLGLRSHTVSKAKVAYEYIKEIDKQVKAKSSGIYESYKPSKEWLAEYKKREYERTASYQRAMNEEIFVRDITSHGNGRDIKKKDLLESREFVIFGYRDDRTVLERLWRTISYYYDSNRGKQKRRRHER